MVMMVVRVGVWCSVRGIDDSAIGHMCVRYVAAVFVVMISVRSHVLTLSLFGIYPVICVLFCI